ncbi:trypsin-1-like [Oratosquilla oratoria]|uniref:trypsin-1-like n=1 Tax=Oratosquilla oratoria TaxID=337810 RepID=UPI003F75ABEC
MDLFLLLYPASLLACPPACLPACLSANLQLTMHALFLLALVAGAFATPHTRAHRPYYPRGLNRIVGGEDAKPGEIPWQVSLQDIRLGYAWHFCGASIIDATHILSAAHCVNDWDVEDPVHRIKVLAGEHTMGTDEGHEQWMTVIKVVYNEDYFMGGHDTSMLTLETPLEFNDYISSIRLPAKNHESSGECMVSGWGALEEGGSPPLVLQKVHVNYISDVDCRQYYAGQTIFNNEICAGVVGGGKDACQGDSGGPLVCYDDGSVYLAGIVSWGTGCARPEYPGVYAQVSRFIDWIEAQRA